MSTFKFVISNPKTRRAYSTEFDQDKMAGLLGKKIGETFNGSLLSLPGYEIEITGGSDKDGFPMHPSVHGSGRRKIVLAHPPGFHPSLKGQRKRKSIHGNTISKDIVQINCKIVKEGSKPIDELLGKKEQPKSVEKEEPVPEKRGEEPKLEKQKKEETKLKPQEKEVKPQPTETKENKK